MDGLREIFLKQTFSSFFSMQYFPANRDQHSKVSNLINPPIIARFVRIIPRGWYRHICMRVEFYGCKAGKLNFKRFRTVLRLLSCPKWYKQSLEAFGKLGTINSTLERPCGNKRVFFNHESHFASPSVMFLWNERPRVISFPKVLTIRTRRERKIN